MRIYGTYKNINDDIISVDIISNKGDRVIEIGGSNATTHFSDDPIQIKSSVDDTFKTIIKSKCSIKLITKEFLGTELFASNARDIKVTIKKNSECIFAGFVVPCTYSQPYANEYESFTINCVDKLSTINNYNYNNITPDNYRDNKIHAANVSFASIIISILNKATVDHGLSGNIYYDNSRSIEDSTTSSFFTNLFANTVLFYGNEEDDIWSQDEVLDEILKYCTLNIKQVGSDFYIFDYNTIKLKNSVKWTNLINSSSKTVTITDKSLSVNDYSSSDTTVSIDDVFNRIQLKCEIEGIDELITSPLEDDSISSPYTNKNKYMTEYLQSKDNSVVSEKDRKINTWYYQYYSNNDWKLKFLQDTTVRDVDTLVQHDSNGTAINQNQIARTSSQYDLFPMICKFGKVKESDASDNSVSNKISMERYMVIRVNGTSPTEDNFSAASAATIAKWNNIVDKTGGIIQYNAAGSGSSLTPIDDSVTNYIVFKGTIALQPAIPKTLVNNNGQWIIDYPMVKCLYNNNATYPKDEGTQIEVLSSQILVPFLDYDEMKKSYQEYYGSWFYYRDEDDTDTISKIPILVCELKIGDKYCVETSESVFEWLTADEAASRDLNTTFALGIDPKLEDYLLETEFDIQTTKMANVDEDGTGIPIRKSDNLSGNISFKILSPSYTGWVQQIRRHPTAFRHTKWWTTNLPLMEFVETIFIKDFSCTIVSDDGGVNNFGDKDLIYMSNENIEYIKTKDDIKFQLNTQLNTTECLEKGVKNQINISSVFTSEEVPIRTIKDHNLNVEGKAEEVYINHYYDEYSQPKLLYETELHLNNNNCWNRYTENHLGKTFFPIEWNIDPTTDTVKCKLKQI